MGKRRSLGATYQREKKKKKYTQKLTQKTKNEIKNRGKSSTPVRAPSKSVLNSGGGSRVGMKVENKSLDNVKKAVKSVIKHQAKAPSKARLNNSLGGRAGQKTERLKLKSYTSGDGLTKREQGLKFKYKQSGFNGMQVGSKEGKKALESGVFSTKTTKKEKANVAKSIEKDYNRKAKNNTNAFIAGLTKSDVNVKTRAKAITGKDIDTSKVTKKGAYKAGDTVQEVASYFVAPTEAVAGKLGAKAVKATAKKLLKKEAIKAGEKATAKATGKALSKKLSDDTVKSAIREIGGKGIAKASTKTANKEAIKSAVKGIEKKAVKEAIEKAGKKTIESRIKRQAIRRGADVIANAPLNARYAVNRATDEKGRTNWKEAGKDFALNTGLDVGIGGTIDAVAGKVRKTKALTRERVTKYETKVDEAINSASKKNKARISGKQNDLRKQASERAKTDKRISELSSKGENTKATELAESTRSNYNAVRGKSVAGKEVLDRGNAIKKMYDRIDRLEKAKKISRKQARQERKALTKAVENRTGRIGFAYRGKNGVAFGRATKKGIEQIDNETYGKALGIDKRFGGKAERIGKKADDVAEAKVAKEPKGKTKATKEPSNIEKVKAKHEQANAEAKNGLTGKDNVEGTWVDEMEKDFKAKDEAEAEELRQLTKGDDTHSGVNADQRSLKERQADARKEINEKYEKGEITEQQRNKQLHDVNKIKKVDDTVGAEQDALKSTVDYHTVDDGDVIRTAGDQNLTKELLEREKEIKAQRARKEELEDKLVKQKEQEYKDKSEDFENVKKEWEESKPTEGTETNVGAEKTAQASETSTKSPKGVKSSEIKETKEAMKHVATSQKRSGAGAVNEFATWARRKMVDSLYFIERDAKKWAKDTGNINFADKMRGELNNLRQAPQMAKHSFENEQIDFNMNKVGRSAKEILQDLNDKGILEDVQAYLYYLNHADRLDAVKSKELNSLLEEYKKIENELAEGKVNPEDVVDKMQDLTEKMDDIEAEFSLSPRSGEKGDKRLFDNLTADDAREKARAIAKENPEVVEGAQEVVKYFQNDLRSQVQSGLLDELSAIHYMRTYPNYVPAHRADLASTLTSKTSAVNPNPKALRAEGSGRNILPLQEQMRMSTDYTFNQGANNQVKTLIAERSGMKKDVASLLDDDVEPMDIATFYDKDKASIKYYDNGKLRTIDLSNIDGGREIVKDLIDQATRSTGTPIDHVLNGLGKVNHGFKALITSYSLPFMIKNFFRDLPEGALQSESTRGYFKQLFGRENSLRSILANDEYYRAYVRSGGAHSQFIDPIKMFNEKSWSKLNPLNRIERLNEITEQIPRMAEFRNALERMGVTPKTATANQLRQASQAAADVTVNFGRSGSWGRIINRSFVPFFNPAIQGADKLIRVVARDKNANALLKLATKASILGIAPAVVNEMALADNPHYKDIQERDRMINYYIPLDKDNPLAKLFGSDTVGAKDGEIMLKIPKARALSVLGAFSQKAMGTLDDTSWGDIVSVAKDQVGPVGYKNNILQQFLNSKIWDNKASGETWYGTPLEGEGDKKDASGDPKKAYKRYDANTSSISIGLAKFIHDKLGKDVSPKKIDYLLDSYTGIVGDVALGRTRKSAQRGLFPKAFSTDTVTQSNVQTRYYDKLSDPYTSKKKREQMRSWSDRIGGVNKAITNIQKSKMSQDEKAEKVRELTKIRNKLMKNALNGKKNTSVTGDMRSIAKVIGNKKAFEMTASASDKKILKKYGKADKNFLKGYVAVKELTAGRKGKADKNSVALALASSGAGKKVAKAYGATTKNKDDIKSAYTRAKEYLKNGGSVEEYKAYQSAMNKAKVSKEKDKYLAKAVVLAKSGAKDRAYSMYDIRSDKVRLARNMSAMGISAKDIEKAKQKAYNGGYANKAQAMAYINSLKGSQAKKSVMLEGIYWWARKYGNPYGKVNASAKDAIKKRISVKGKASDDGPEGWVTPHRKGWEIDPKTKKRIKNGKTVGSVGERVALPAGRTYKELKRDEKAGRIKKVTVEERLHNAFGSRIGDVKKKKVYKPSTIKKVEKDKKGNVDIHFANGEAWRNPPSKKPKDNTQLEESGSGRSGRGWRRWRRWRRYGRGGGRGGRGGRVSMPSVNAKVASSPTTKNLKLKGYLKPSGKQGITVRANDLKEHGGLTKSELKALIKASRKSTSARTKGPKAESKDIYKTRGSQRRK